MIEVWYFNLLNFKQEVFEECLDTLPSSLKEEVVYYKFFKDQVARLAGRLLIRKAIIETGYPPDLLTTWRKDKNEKPFITGWMPFNISHSKDLVIIAFGGQSAIGIDIEFTETKLDTASLSFYFCREERELILNSHHQQNTFFDFWVRKEAILKAMGKGIVNGLNEFDCREDIIEYDHQKWYLKKLQIHNSYISYLAINDERSIVNTREIFLPLNNN